MSIHIIIELDENTANVEHAIELAHTIEEVITKHCLKEVRVETGRDTLIEMTQEDFDILMSGAKEVGRLEIKAEILELADHWKRASESEGVDFNYRTRAIAREAVLKHYASNHI